MEVIVQQGSILTPTTGHIIHGCNAQGVMGSGVAKVLREKYPTVYTIYKSIYDINGLKLGWSIPVFVTKDLVVWNLITQDNYGRTGSRYVSYDAIVKSLEYMQKFIDNNSNMFYAVDKTIHAPRIGAGLGGGNWNIIRTILAENQSNFNKTIIWEI